MNRVLCLWFPHWPLQRICLVQPELKGSPVVLYGPARQNSSAQGGDWLVRHCSKAAVAAGVRPGMPLAEAQALFERHLPRATHRATSQHNSLPLEGGGSGWGWSHETLAPPPRPSPTRGEGESCAACYNQIAHIAQHDSEADRRLLQLLAGWCARYSPLVGMEQIDEPSALFFDITGCAPLFGGEEHMAALVLHDFE